MSRILIDLTGQRFGRLTALHVVGQDRYKCTLWHSVCDCGQTKDVSTRHLRSGVVRSCGCLAREMARLGGKARGEQLKAQAAPKRPRVSRTIMGTRVLRQAGVIQHRMDATDQGGRPVTGPVAYGKPDLFAFPWPPVDAPMAEAA